MYNNLVFFYQFYPKIVKEITLYELQSVNSRLFLLLFLFIIVILSAGWSVRNKLWLGLPFALNYYNMTRRLRIHIKDARFEDEREFDTRLVMLPKIKIIFDCNRSRISRKTLIRNSIKFDQKLKKMRIDSQK